MKTLLVFVCLFLGTIASFGNSTPENKISGQSMTTLGEYTIQTSEKPMVIEGITFDTYSLVYEHAERPILIGIESGKKCKNFIVKGPGFEIAYVCKKGVFGARYINPVYRQIKEEVNLVVIDERALESQKVISVSQKTEEQLLALLACYLPLVVKEEFRDQI